MKAGTRSAGSELLGTLAHELRNPLASVQGCAMTLLERGDDLPVHTRDGLTKVIVGQSQRLDWLVRATAALGGVTQRFEVGPVDMREIVTEAAEFATVQAVAPSPVIVFADAARLRLAIEALLLGMGAGATDVSVVLDAGSVTVQSSGRDLSQGGKRWKIDLARRILREEGCHMTLRRLPGGTSARVRLPAPDDVPLEEE